MADRYYKISTKTMLFDNDRVPAHLIYDSGNPDHVAIDESNPYFSAIPAGQQLTYDGSGVPDGLEARPLSEAKEIAKGKVRGAKSAANLSINSSDGTFTYDLTSEELVFLGASSAGIDLLDDTNTIRTLTAGAVTTLRQAWETSWELNQANLFSESAAIDSAIDVPAIEILLAGSSFGDLSPVWGA